MSRLSRKNVVRCMRLLAGRYIGARRTASELKTRMRAVDDDPSVIGMLERSVAGAEERMAALEAIITAIAVEASRGSLLRTARAFEVVPPALQGDEPATRGAWYPPETVAAG
jgi:hypothetical protein